MQLPVIHFIRKIDERCADDNDPPAVAQEQIDECSLAGAVLRVELDHANKFTTTPIAVTLAPITNNLFSIMLQTVDQTTAIGVVV